MKIPAWTAGVPAMAWPTLPAAAGRLVAFGLHDFLRTMIGHSKGALVIKNAIRSVTDFEARDATIVTLGCPIDEECKGVRHCQYLGLFDLLGQLNGWGNLPDDWPPSTHTTDPYLPLALPMDVLLSEQARA